MLQRVVSTVSVGVLEGISLDDSDGGLLNQLVKKLAEFPFGCAKHSLSFFGGRILTPRAAPLAFHFDGKIAFLLQTMQQWIDRARADR